MITERISHFVTETTAHDVPREASDLACLGITDFVGVALAGIKEDSAKIIVNYARKSGGVPEASIIGSGFKTTSKLAALANGTIGHGLDYDDIAISLIGHPSVFLVPAVLAIGEVKGSSGENILTAYVVGYETACYLALPLLQSHYTQGWHSTATFGTLGATAAVAWLLKLEPYQVKMALGIGASLAGGLRQNFGTMTKPLHAGQAAANAIQAASLAQAGFTADENIIEAPLGFAHTFGHTAEVDWDEVGRNLGKTYLISGKVGISFKPYPTCGFTHPAVDAALSIQKEYKPNLADITEIELGVSPFDKQVLIHHNPRTGLEGKFSLEYCVARALLSGRVRLSHLTDEAVGETRVRHLMKIMKWVEKYPIPVMGTPEGLGVKSVTVRLKDGAEYSKEVTIAKGMPQNPLSPTEFKAKYRDCASTVLDKDQVENSLSVLTNLRKLTNIQDLLGVLATR